MGLVAGGLQSGSPAPATVVADLVGQDIVAQSYTASQASGSNAYAATIAGARWSVGGGAADYFSSNATTITFAGPVTVSKTLATSGGSGVSDFVCGGDMYAGSGLTFSVGFATGNLTFGGSLNVSSYTDDSATAGNRTVNKVRGKNSIASGAATCVITNSYVTVNSQIICTLEFADATLTFINRVVPAAGSFTITCNLAATLDTKFSWIVIK